MIDSHRARKLLIRFKAAEDQTLLSTQQFLEVKQRLLLELFNSSVSKLAVGRSSH